jgi:hypothetical protein
MDYLETAKRLLQRRRQAQHLEFPYIESAATRNETNETNEETSAELPVLETRFTRGHEALRQRVLQLGAERGYPALSLGQYRIRKRVGTVGLFPGESWWKHQTNYFGDALLAAVARALQS